MKKDLIKIYEHLYLYNKTKNKLTYEFDNRINGIEIKITKLIDVLAWCIPIKNIVTIKVI